jgi:hypothetical protein
MVRDLADVLADAREEAAILKRRGFTHIAEAIEELADAVAKSAEDYLVFVPESQALLRGAKLAVLRRNFAEWEKDGHARRRGGVREYRAIMLPRVTPASIAREAGRRGERPDNQRRAG